MRVFAVACVLFAISCTVKVADVHPDGATGPSNSSAPGEPDPQPWPEPEFSQPTFEPGAPIVDVPQHPLPPPEEWRFEVTGVRVAARLEDGCEIWDVESGLHLGHWTGDGDNPCDTWREPAWVLGYDPGPYSSDGISKAVIDDSSVELHAEGTLTRTLECRGCAAVRHVAWTQQGHRIAILRVDGRLELWNTDSGQRERTLSTGPKLARGEWIKTSALAWNALGIVVSHDVARPNGQRGKWGQEHETHDWRALLEVWTETGKRLHTSDRKDYVVFDHAFVDPSVHWLFVVYNNPNPLTEKNRRLTVYSLDARESAIEWVERDRSIDHLRHTSVSRNGRWRVDTTTSWMADYFEDHTESPPQLGIAVLQLEPTPAFERVKLLEEGEDPIDDYVVEVFAHHRGHTIAEWAYTLIDGSRVEYPALAEPVSGCVLVDVSPDLETEVLRCSQQLRVRRNDRIREFQLGTDPRWIWGRSGWLAIASQDGVVILDADNELVAELHDVQLLEATLANVHDIVALRRDDSLDLFNPLTKEQRAIAHPPDQVALSPDGRRVAVMSDRTLRIFASEDGTLLVRWHWEHAHRIAFSQDGRYLYAGDTEPQRARNSWTGEVVHDAVPRLPDGELDPGWRWSASEHNRVVRVSDGLAIQVGPGWAMLDDGRFDGTPPDWLTPERHFRVGDTPTVPRCRMNDLAALLRRPGLAEDFFTGRPIAPAVVPFDEVGQIPCAAGSN